MSIESIAGNLKEAYAQIQPGTMRTAPQIQAERRTDRSMQNQFFWTPEGPTYALLDQDRNITPDGTPSLAITNEQNNLVFRHLDDKVDSSYDQLVRTHNYRPNRDEAQGVIKADTTVVIDLTQLRLGGKDNEWRYLEISTSPEEYSKLNTEERKLASVYHGNMVADASGQSEFDKSMTMLREGGIQTTRVYVLNPKYVSKEASKNPVSRASWLNGFGGSSDAGAAGRDVNDDGRVRGVRLVVDDAEGVASLSNASNGSGIHTQV